MENRSKNEGELLGARAEQLKGEIERIKKEAAGILRAKQKGHRFNNLPSEDDGIKKKIAAELIQRENEILNIQALIGREATKQVSDAKRLKALIEDKGLKRQVRDILNKGKSTKGYLMMAECDPACQDCVWCDYNCLTSCTSCVACISDEVVGSLPDPSANKK